MSKVDAQRAMREAKYARLRASGPAAARAVSPSTAPTAASAPGERCGHTSINGRACTREAAHAETSHRYS